MAALFCLAAAGLSAQEGRAAAIAAAMDNSALAAHVIMSGVDGSSRLGAEMGRIFRECPPGAVMLFRYNLNGPADTVRMFLDECRTVVEQAVRAASSTAVPPFFAVDHEGGQVHRFGPGIARLPAAASWEERAGQEGRAAALAALEAAAYESGKEIRGLGLNLSLAPVAEVLNNDNRSFLEDRSFSADAVFAADAAAAYIRGMERAGVGCVAKHFPGNSGADPHKDAAVLAGSREELAQAVRPFAALIRDASSGGPPLAGIMVSHALVPAWDPERIGSVSPVLINSWLRGDLGFRGIVLADDFSMTAAASRVSPEEAAVLSLAAGADMVMAWPSGLRKLHRAILAALERGALSRSRLEEAAARIIAEKIRLGLL
ncbi:MAG: glycoside hydrolase family 3 protein [Treponema sp.]|nr:glycoside hydrolase family 3 protein [Treponema sp.]